MRAIGRILFAVFPAICLVAIVWYAWPRSVTDPAPGAVLTQYYPRLLWVPFAGLLVHAYAYLAIRTATARRAIAASGVLRFGLTHLGLAAILIGALVMLWRMSPILFLGSLFALSAGSWIAAAVIMRTAHTPKRARVGPAALSTLCLILSPWLFIAGFMTYFMPWYDVARLRAPGGRIILLQRSGERHVLSQQIHRGTLFLRTRVIAGTYNKFLNVAIVRPARAGYRLDAKWKADGRLVRSTDGKRIAYIYRYDSYPSRFRGCATNVAYDLSTGQRWSAESQSERLFSVSPFVLVGPNDPINTTDVRAMLETDACFVSQAQSEDMVVALRHHRNPWVRVAVSLLQRTLSKDAAQLTRDLTREAATDTDPKQHAAAQGALAWLRQLRGDQSRVPAGREPRR